MNERSYAIGNIIPGRRYIWEKLRTGRTYALGGVTSYTLERAMN